MKKTIFFLFGILIFVHCSAQDPLTASFSKKKPVQVLSLDGSIGNAITLKQLQKHSNFRGGDAQEVYDRVHNAEARPSSTGNNAEEVLSHYKAYELASFRFVTGYGYALVWLPQAENQHMPEGMQLPLPQGLLIWLQKKHVTDNGKSSTGTTLPLAGTPVMRKSPDAASAGTQNSAASANTFNKTLLGCMVYENNDKSVMYVIPIAGKAIKNEAATADAAFKSTVSGGGYARYEWLPGANPLTVISRYASTAAINMQQTYTIK